VIGATTYHRALSIAVRLLLDCAAARAECADGEEGIKLCRKHSWKL
jgi:hypothetical protein